MYLYKQPAKTNNLVISAHGGFDDDTGQLDLEKYDGSVGNLGVQLYFFGQHGRPTSYKILNGVGKNDFATFDRYSTTQEDKANGKNSVFNYHVFKFPEDDEAKIISAMKTIYNDKTPNLPVRDVLSIRNRTMGSTVTLGKIIKKTYPLGYRNYFCLFCRSGPT